MSPKGERLKDEGSKRQVITAGAVAGLISRFVIAPLDVVKIRLQLQPSSLSDPLAPKRATRRTTSTIRHIFQNEGLTGFWKGNVPAELMYLCYGALQFGTYRTVTLALHSGFEGKLPNAAESFVAGASAGALATSVTYPLDLLRTRFAAQGSNKIYGSLLGAVRDIRRDEGMKGFFRGIGPGLAQIIPFMGIFFVSYESLRLVLGDMNMPWGSGDATAGAIGSVIAKTSVFPLDLVRKRIQVQGPTRSKYVYGNIPEYKSAVRALSMIVRADGIRGLYKGLSISLIKSAPASAVTLWTYERALHAIISYENKSEAIP